MRILVLDLVRALDLNDRSKKIRSKTNSRRRGNQYNQNVSVCLFIMFIVYFYVGNETCIQIDLNYLYRLRCCFHHEPCKNISKHQHYFLFVQSLPFLLLYLFSIYPQCINNKMLVLRQHDTHGYYFAYQTVMSMNGGNSESANYNSLVRCLLSAYFLIY